MRVLDSAAFVDEYHTDRRTASIPPVREELEGEASFRFDAMEGAGMHVHVPAGETIEKVRRAAGEVGEDALTDTDLRLLAAAFELDATLVTDDYAIRTVADHLSVAVELVAADADGAGEWTFQCQGCGREFEEESDRCPICGSDLSRTKPA